MARSASKLDEALSLEGPWTCDSCGQAIAAPEEGWVEWLVKERKDGEGLFGRRIRLVHAHPASPRTQTPRCQYDQDREFARDRSTVSDLPMHRFMGVDGLMLLLELIGDRAVARRGVVELAKRLHIPGYERARPYFKQAMSAGVFETNRAPGFYDQRQIAKTLRWLDEGRPE